MEKRRKWRCGPRPTPKQPQSTCSSPPWNPFSRKAGFSRTALPQLTPQLSLNSPPRPESWRSLPPRWAAAEESCPRRSGCGKRVLAAPCVRREWSCCKMAAEAHAAGSKPDPVPLASERAPGARARPRDPPLSLPSLRASAPHSLPQPVPSSSSSFPPTTTPPVSVCLVSACRFPLPAPFPHCSHSRLRPLKLEWPPFSSSLARSLAHSLPLSLSQPRPPVSAESAPLFLSPALT